MFPYRVLLHFFFHNRTPCFLQLRVLSSGRVPERSTCTMSGTDNSPPPLPLAMPSMVDIFQNGKCNLKNKKMQRSANALQWRQKYQNSPIYDITLEDQRTFSFKQIGNGEIKGIGTGAVVVFQLVSFVCIIIDGMCGQVWPAAHVLAMYMEVLINLILIDNFLCCELMCFNRNDLVKMGFEVLVFVILEVVLVSLV